LKIIRLDFNYHECGIHGDQWGDDCETVIVGEKGCIEIIEHPSQGDGDKWYYEVFLKGGSSQKIFNPNCVFFEPEGD